MQVHIEDDLFTITTIHTDDNAIMIGMYLDRDIVMDDTHSMYIDVFLTKIFKLLFIDMCFSFVFIV